VDFSLTEEQEDLRGLAAQIFGGRATPERVAAAETTTERFDRDLWRELAKAGLVGIGLPGEAGGLELGLVELLVVCEEHGRTVAPVPLVWTATAALAVAAHGTLAQQEHWLPGVCAGDVVLTSTLPVGAGDLRVSGGRLSGTALAVPYGHVADAVLVPVGDRLYALDPAGPGVTRHLGESTNHEVAAMLVCDGAPVEPVGGPGAADWLWQRTAVALAGVQAGVTAAALRLAADYTSARKQFDKPLSSFQGVALKAADGYIDNACIRATALQAAWRLDQEEATKRGAGLGDGDDGRLDPAATTDAAVLTAAWWAAEAGQHCVHLTQHVHGGVGADVTYPVHRYFLWGKQIELMLGGASATLARLGDVLAVATPRRGGR
jgi:acyl-CoA dehydrogenase